MNKTLATDFMIKDLFYFQFFIKEWKNIFVKLQ